MWKSDDEESNLLESVVNWAQPMPVQTIGSKMSSTTSTSIPCVQTPPLPPPSPFSEIFPHELLQSSGLLMSQFDDVINSSEEHDRAEIGINDDNNDFRHREMDANSESGNAINTGSMYRCAECKFSTEDRRLFMCHKRSKHAGEKSFSCPDCSAKFTRQYSLKKHVLQKHPAMCPNPATQLPKYCPFPNCKYATRNPNSMQLHKRTHQQQQLYFCKECNTRYTRRQSLLGHLTKHHGSNAALIGMRPSPAVSVIDDQSLQSPPPSTTVSSSAPFFQQPTDAASADSPSVREDDREELQPTSASSFPQEEPVSSSLNAKSSSQFNVSDAATESINAVVGSVVATVAASSHESLDTRFYCDKCHFTTNSLRQLYGHKISSHRGPKEKLMAKTSHQICPHCPRKFDSLKRMMAHVKKTHTTAIKTPRKKPSKSGGKQRRQYTKRRPQPPMSMSCERCDFTTSRKRVFAAHIKSHATESSPERNQDPKHDGQTRKPNSVMSKRFTPDRILLDTVTSAANPVVNSPSSSPSAYDFYHTGSGTRHNNGSGSASTHSSGSIHDFTAPNGGNFGQVFVLNHRNSSTSSNNSFASDHSTSNRLIRLDLNNQSTSGFDEMAACLQGLQQANGAMMQLVRRRENELRSLRSNVVELLRLLVPNSPAFHHVLTLDNVDDMVTNALNRILQEAATHK